jgi:hypothetical protein
MNEQTKKVNNKTGNFPLGMRACNQEENNIDFLKNLEFSGQTSHTLDESFHNVLRNSKKKWILGFYLALIHEGIFLQKFYDYTILVLCIGKNTLRKVLYFVIKILVLELLKIIKNPVRYMVRTR